MTKRLTNNPATNDTAWQKQLRDQYISEGLPVGLLADDLALKRAIVRPVSYNFARRIILKYEWLGTMANSRIHYGIFFGNYCAGVTCVAVGTGTGGINVPKEFGLDYYQLAILTRGACVHWAPSGTNSKLVSWTCRLLSKIPNLQLVMAYADTDAGEIGTIYQACNWTYLGRGNSVLQFVNPSGKIYDQKLVYNLRHQHGLLEAVSWGRQRQALLDAGWNEQVTNPKHRYAFVLNQDNQALVARIEALKQRYPKRG